MTQRHPSRRLSTALIASLAMAWIQVSAPASVAGALAPIDFGNVTVGEGLELGAELPLEYSLSQLPAGTVLYSGGNPTVDFALGTMGLSAPLTSDALFAAIGEVTATFHLTFTLTSGIDFSVAANDCEIGTGACTVNVTFAPTESGLLTDTVHPHPIDVDVTGSGTFAALIDLMAPFLVPQIESQLDIPVIGYGATPTGGLQLRVSVAREAAPCVLLDVSEIDFGTLPFSTEAALSEGSAGVSVSSCSTGSQALYTNGSDATGSGATPALWSLSSVGGNPCGIGVNAYGVSLGTDGSGGMPATFQLSTTSSSWIVMGAAANVPASVDYQMPCVGSDGAGQTMSSQVLFLATVP